MHLLFGPQEARKAQLENHEPEDEEEDMDMDKDAQDSGLFTLIPLLWRLLFLKKARLINLSTSSFQIYTCN